MSDALKPWYAVAIPHEDVREGWLAEAVFAANLWAVVQGTAPEVYLDPEEFFRKTYLTTGFSSRPHEFDETRSWRAVRDGSAGR